MICTNSSLIIIIIIVVIIIAWLTVLPLMRCLSWRCWWVNQTTWWTICFLALPCYICCINVMSIIVIIVIATFNTCGNYIRSLFHVLLRTCSTFFVSFVYLIYYLNKLRLWDRGAIVCSQQFIKFGMHLIIPLNLLETEMQLNCLDSIS